MNLGQVSLLSLVQQLRDNEALTGKALIQPVARAFGGEARPGRPSNGDDAAAIPDGDGYLLLAAEGMQPAFVERDPHFAGFCAVMANVSDIASMGGRPLAVVDVLFKSGEREIDEAILAGLSEGAERFGVPIVGGHTGRTTGGAHLAAAILGRAQRLITSFDVRPGDALLACIDLRGRYRGGSDWFDAVTRTNPIELRAQLGLLPRLAETGLVHAGKDISMAGLLGTLVMLLETSGCGAEIEVETIPAPRGASAEPARWLRAFPSYGYLLAADPRHIEQIGELFARYGVSAAPIGRAVPGSQLALRYGGESVPFWDLSEEPLVGFAAPLARKSDRPDLETDEAPN